MVGVSSSLVNQNKVFLKMYLDKFLNICQSKACAENSAQNLKVDFPHLIVIHDPGTIITEFTVTQYSGTC